MFEYDDSGYGFASYDAEQFATETYTYESSEMESAGEAGVDAFCAYLAE